MHGHGACSDTEPQHPGPSGSQAATQVLTIIVLVPFLAMGYGHCYDYWLREGVNMFFHPMPPCSKYSEFYGDFKYGWKS